MATDEQAVAQQVSKFDFIPDSELRMSLTSDYMELEKCFQAGGWKAVHVLSGSVVEALLLEYLVAVNHQKTCKKDLLRLQLDELIAICKEIGILSERAVDLSTVIRGYRNLIHPGRVLRLKERVDGNSATVAKALVDMVVEDVAIARKEKYGFTAEQIVVKIDKDPTCLHILSRLLKEAQESERERLILEVIPTRYAAAVNPAGLKECFRMAFDMVPASVKKKVAANFVKIIKEGSADAVLAYETAFFRASDLEFLSVDDAELVMQRLYGRLEREPSQELVATLVGLGKIPNQEHATTLFFWLMYTAVTNRDDDRRKLAAHVLISEYRRLPKGELRQKFDGVVADFEQTAQGDETAQDRVRPVKEKITEIRFLEAKVNPNEKPF